MKDPSSPCFQTHVKTRKNKIFLISEVNSDGQDLRVVEGESTFATYKRIFQPSTLLFIGAHMKRKILGLALLISATGVQLANASDGTINFEGLLSANTCVISVNGVPTSAVATVTLPTVSTSLLATAGQVAGATDFVIRMSGCSPSSGFAAAYFEAGSGVDPLTGNVKNTSGTATNVQFQLLDASNGHVIVAGDSNQRTNTTHQVIDSGAATLPYAVQYFAQDATTAGTVVGSVTYSIDYQ